MIWKRLNSLCLLLVLTVAFSCKKENDHGDVLVKVKYNGETIDQPMIYMKKGTLTNPNIPLSQYDKSQSGDAVGQATFEDLESGNYFFYGTGYSQAKGGYVSGEANVTVKSRYRENSYKLTINCN